MGNMVASRGVAAVTSVNTQYTSGTFLNGVTAYRQNLARKLFQGNAPGNQGVGIFSTGNMSVVSGAIGILYFFSFFGLSRQFSDDRAKVIDKRHGYENYMDMPQVDRARINNWQMKETNYDLQLPAHLRYTAEQRLSSTTLMAKLDAMEQ